MGIQQKLSTFQQQQQQNKHWYKYDMTPEAASHHKYIYFHIIKYIEHIFGILYYICFIPVMSSYVLHILLLDCKNKDRKKNNRKTHKKQPGKVKTTNIYIQYNTSIQILLVCAVT